MYYIGIDVHKKKCVTTIKGDAKKVLKRTSFDNDITGINGFIWMLRSDGYLPATAACESTGNYWIVLHDTLEAAGIDTLRHDPQLRIGPSMPIILQMRAPKHATFV